MNSPRASARPMIEHLDARPAVNVPEAEYRRLLGYPKHHTPGERADELAEWARGWYAEHGRPWVYLREVELQVAPDTLRIDGTEFHSQQLHTHLRRAGAERAMLVAVSAGRGCEEHARLLWQEARPDEYFFLEIFGSAVVEHLVASLSGRICALAERDGLMAVAHYSPGYTGWDVADQNKLFDLVTRGMSQPFPEPAEVMSSGMLRPKKSLLAVVGLTARHGRARVSPNLVPCEACSFSPCQYRRLPWRNAPVEPGSMLRAAPRPAVGVTALTREVSYTVNRRALKKWARERVRFKTRADGSIDACFHFDGTTCSDLGRPLAFDYEVTLGAAQNGHTILRADCRPSPGGDGHTFMCAYLSDSDGLMKAIATEKPWLGRPLDDVLGWNRAVAPSGCHCSTESRAHKWGLALEVIHYALAQAAA
jgi:hypothetical protein